MSDKNHKSKKAEEHIIPIVLEGDNETNSNKMETENGFASTVDDLLNSSNENGLVVDSDDDREENGELPLMEIPQKMLPSYNVPEKIIIVYDCAIDEVSTNFVVNKESFSPPDMLKRSVRFFLRNKQEIDPRHQFALVVMNDSDIVWLKDFTDNIEEIIRMLQDVKTCEAEDVISLNKLFNLIEKKVSLSVVKSNFNVPPSFVVRTLFIYGRSFTMPELEQSDFKEIIDSPYFTFDVLMTHETPSVDNNCNKIFNCLQSIDTKGFAYFFPVARNARDLHVAMAKLLSHPLQRARQRDANYRINIENK